MKKFWKTTRKEEWNLKRLCVSYKVYLVELAKLRRKKEDIYGMVYVVVITATHQIFLVFFLLQGCTGLLGPLVVGWHHFTEFRPMS